MSRRLYEDILMWKQLMEMNKGNSEINWDILNDKLIELKRKARKANKQSNAWFSADEIVFANEMESAVFKYPLPEHIKTMDEAEDYFGEYECLYCRPSPYDCTGQRFTAYHHIFQKPDGRFWVYHRVGMDV